jgi:hypothetical protein
MREKFSCCARKIFVLREKNIRAHNRLSHPHKLKQSGKKMRLGMLVVLGVALAIGGPKVQLFFLGFAFFLELPDRVDVGFA